MRLVVSCNKINVDGGFGWSRERAAAATICITEQGSYLGALVIVVEGIKDPASMHGSVGMSRGPRFGRGSFYCKTSGCL